MTASWLDKAKTVTWLRHGLAILNIVPFFLYLFGFITPRTDVGLKRSLITFTNSNDPGKEVRLGPLRSCKRGGASQVWVCDGTNIAPDYTRYLADIVSNSSSIIPRSVRPVPPSVNTAMMIGWTTFLVYWVLSYWLFFTSWKNKEVSFGVKFKEEIHLTLVILSLSSFIINGLTILISYFWLDKGVRDFNIFTAQYGLTHGLHAHVGSAYIWLFFALGLHFCTTGIHFIYHSIITEIISEQEPIVEEAPDVVEVGMPGSTFDIVEVERPGIFPYVGTAKSQLSDKQRQNLQDLHPEKATWLQRLYRFYHKYLTPK